LTNDQSKGIQLSFTGDKLCLTSSTPEAGDAEINMKIDYKYNDANIGFNPQYLLEVLRVVDEPEVIFEFSDGGRPGILRSGKDFLYVIMPVAV
jgi:DNA polymerase-3 subunit beta